MTVSDDGERGHKRDGVRLQVRELRDHLSGRQWAADDWRPWRQAEGILQ